MKTSLHAKLTNLKNFIAIFLIVVLVIVSFFLLIRNEVVILSTEKLSLIAEDCTDSLSRWAEKILCELNIYQDIVEREGGVMTEHTCEILSTSLGTHSEYPYGMYWADKNDNFYMTSGWYKPDYKPTEQSWYEEGLGHIRFEFGEPYIDQFTGNACVSATARANNNGVEGVMAVDVYLDYVSELVSQLSSRDIETALIVTKRSRIVVADSDASMYMQKLSEIDASLYRGINDLLDRHFLGQTVVHADGVNYYVNINQIENTDWLFVTCMNQKVLSEILRRAEVVMVFIGIVVCIALILLTLFVSRRMNAADRKAKSDPLTNLLNHDGLRDKSIQAIEQKPNQGLLLIMDMDNFKRINDQFGHPEGDEVLKGFAEMLTGYFSRNLDYIARLGGDEFAVFVGRQMAREDIVVMLERFIGLFHQRYDEKYSVQKLSISIGAAFVENCVGDYNELYRCADEALYKAKQNGKNCYAIES